MKNDHFQTPENIDDYIEKGLHMGVRLEKRKRRSILGITSSLLLLFLLVTSIKVSPVFANTLKTIPGLGEIVNLIEGDKGLEEAVENDFIHEIQVNETHRNVMLSVDRMIVDHSRMILFYTIETTGDYDYLRLYRPTLLDQNGEEMMASLSYNDPREGEDFLEEKKMTGKIDVNIPEGVEIPETLVLRTELQETSSPTSITGSKLDPLWKLEIPIDKEWFVDMREVIPVQKSVEMQGQLIYFEKMVITPTRIGLHVNLDENNKMQLFHFDNLALMDEKGKVWERSNGGIIRTGTEDEFVLYFQSNYFQKFNKLYLKGSTVRAISKKDKVLTIDVEAERILNAPGDREIILKKVDKIGNNIQIELTIEVEEQDRGHHYQLFSDQLANENTEIQESTSTRDDELIAEKHITIFNPKNRNVINLEFINYPGRIKDPFTIKIK